MPVLYDESLEKPPSPDRLRAMIVALASGETLTAELRAEIQKALQGVEVRARNDELRSQRGRDFAHNTFNAAALARILIDDYGIPAKAASCAAAESTRMHIDRSVTDEAVARTYRKLKQSGDGSLTLNNGDKVVSALISDAYINDALARVPISAKRGNK